MGHEYCGIVEEVGPAVRSVKPGQFVVTLDHFVMVRIHARQLVQAERIT
jgi:threonine dehydrogenase-like Zn-dependent dehydrogenase